MAISCVRKHARPKINKANRVAYSFLRSAFEPKGGHYSAERQIERLQRYVWCIRTTFALHHEKTADIYRHTDGYPSRPGRSLANSVPRGPTHPSTLPSVALDAWRIVVTLSSQMSRLPCALQ
jgi:hypothetical protein